MKITVLHAPNIEEILQEVGKIATHTDISAQEFFNLTYNKDDLSSLDHLYFSIKMEGISFCCTQPDIIMTATFKELLNMMKKRLCFKSQENIRNLFIAIKEALKPVMPDYMYFCFLPKCFPDGCKEESCGWWKINKDIYLTLKKDYDKIQLNKKLGGNDNG